MKQHKKHYAVYVVCICHCLLIFASGELNQRALVGKAVAVGQGVVNETLEQAINATQRYLFFKLSIFSGKHTCA